MMKLRSSSTTALFFCTVAACIISSKVTFAITNARPCCHYEAQEKCCGGRDTSCHVPYGAEITFTYTEASSPTVACWNEKTKCDDSCSYSLCGAPISQCDRRRILMHNLEDKSVPVEDGAFALSEYTNNCGDEDYTVTYVVANAHLSIVFQPATTETSLDETNHQHESSLCRKVFRVDANGKDNRITVEEIDAEMEDDDKEGTVVVATRTFADVAMTMQSLTTAGRPSSDYDILFFNCGEVPLGVAKLLQIDVTPDLVDFTVKHLLLESLATDEESFDIIQLIKDHPFSERTLLDGTTETSWSTIDEMTDEALVKHLLLHYVDKFEDRGEE